MGESKDSGRDKLPDVVSRAADLEKVVGGMGLYLPPDIISGITGVPVTEVRLILRRAGSKLSPEERELAEDVRVLAKKAIAKAHRILAHGHPDQQLTVMRTVLSNASRLIGEDNNGSETGREAIMSLFADMRKTPATVPVLTDDEGIVDVEASAAPPATHYQE